MGDDDAEERARQFCARTQGLKSLYTTSTTVRAAYSSDASLYRLVPQVVAFPRHVDDVVQLVSAAAEVELPLTTRGAGTSCAGNAVGAGLIVDMRALNHCGNLDVEARTINVGAGLVQADLQRVAGRAGLRFGPDPSTSSRCTVGGILGNNACGPRAMGFGRAADVCVDLEFVGADGELRRVSTSNWSGLEALIDQHLGSIRLASGRFSRQISGYSLEHLLPEFRRRDPHQPHGRDVAGFFVGTEGTLGVITSATLSLSPLPRHTVLAVAGFGSIAEAADAVVGSLEFSPTACEGLDQRLLDVARRRGRHVAGLPEGEGFLLLEFSGDDAAEVRERASAALRAMESTSTCLASGQEAQALWQVRGEAAGLAALAFDSPAHAGWEDAAVPPAHLGAYLRAFEQILIDHGLNALPYGHFGDGCVHARIDFPLTTSRGPARYRAFVEAAADVVASFGGSLSGEHGDGRARSELLPRMYPADILKLFGAVKHHFDPKNLLNPGVIVEPCPVDAALRSDGPSSIVLRHPATDIAARCTGVGACVSHQGGTMCPSFRATRNEIDSTRGRARVLQEVARGQFLEPRLDAPEVREALHHCLACKACLSECPTSTDMAQIKSLALEEQYRRRPRPLGHYTLGWLPTWIRAARHLPWIRPLSRWAGHPMLGPLRRLAGVDPSRAIPSFDPPSLRWDPSPGRPIAVWVDSFSQGFGKEHVDAVLLLLRRAGFAPELVDARVCCGLTWITTGQRERAADVLRPSLEHLWPYRERELDIVVTEPSCLASFRDDARNIVDDDRVEPLIRSMKSLGEALAHWEPPSLSGTQVVVQSHCHATATRTVDADIDLLRRAGADVVDVGGCCGMAGNFGMDPATVDLSRAVAALDLAPALAKHPDAVVVADGFSCRSQLEDMGVRALSVAQIVATAVAPTQRPRTR